MRWLLLRGLTRERRHWARFPEVFERAMPGARTIGVDLPGVGTEAGQLSPASVPEIVDHVRARWPRSEGGPWSLLGISLGGMLAVMFYLDWRFSLVSLAVAPVLFVVVFRLTRRIKRATRAVKRKESELASVVQESISSIRVVKAFGSEDYEERRFDAFRAYYSYVPKGTFVLEYTVRLNNSGSFVLPATRVEAMYAPEMFGELPNATLQVRSGR